MEYENIAVFEFGEGHDGIGWYWWDEEYPDEGSWGAYKTKDEVLTEAKKCGYIERD